VTHTFRYRIAGDLAPGALVDLPADDSHHLARVVRRATGDAVELLDPHGRIWPAVVESPGPPATVRVIDAPRTGPPLAPVDLYLGSLDGGRLDLVVEKITEIGLASITLMSCERGKQRGGQEAFDRRRARLTRVVEAATRQCGRAERPALRGLVPFSTVIAEVDTAHAFLVDPEGELGLGHALRGRLLDRAAILVGPDAGFSGAELDAARSRGVAVCRLGDATLRAETAAIVATSLVADALGFLGSGA
jgi:16S rRNA (uracil1498-N3)-methyltransferase